MDSWLYFGNQTVRDSFVVAVPPVLLNRGYFSPDDSIYWFKRELGTGFANHLTKEALPRPGKSQRQFSEENDSHVVTLKKEYRENEEGERRFVPGNPVHFVASEEMMNGDDVSVYLLNSKELLNGIRGPEAWSSSSDNLTRLTALKEIEDLRSLLPDELVEDVPSDWMKGRGGVRYTLRDTFDPGKGGKIQIETCLPKRVRARWLKDRSQVMTVESPVWKYFVIESEFEISDRENRELEQIGETEQYMVRYETDSESWDIEEEQGQLDHIPGAISSALEENSWNIQE